MRLQVNLIPALAYALVTMFSNMAGLTGSIEKSPGKQQNVSIQSMHQESKLQERYVMVAKNGQVSLSNGHENANLVWKIPYTPPTN